jgi:hypothetical protein
MLRLIAPFHFKLSLARAFRSLAWPLAFIVCIVLTPAGRARLFKWLNSHLSEEALRKKHPWFFKRKPPRK